MIRLIHILCAALALGVSGAAQAGLTEAELKTVFTAKGLTIGIERTDVEEGATIQSIGVQDVFGFRSLFLLVDGESDGNNDLLVLMTAYGGTAAALPVLNSFNKEAACKAFVQEGLAHLMLPIVTVGRTDVVSVASAYDLFRMEYAQLGSILRSSMSSVGVAVSMNDGDGDRRADAGMARHEIADRDHALAASLNRQGIVHQNASEADDEAFWNALSAAAERQVAKMTAR